MSVLILVLSADVPPYDAMIQTSMDTWDSKQIPGCQTVYYCGESSKSDTDKIIYLPVPDHLFNIGNKTLTAFEWALQNKEFDYIARVHSSIYVNKEQLMDYIPYLNQTGVFSGIEAPSQNGFQYVWGGTGYIISKDVIRLIVDNKQHWDHTFMEDESMSLLVRKLGIPFTGGNRACSIDKKEHGWQCTSYCGNSTDFTDFKELAPLKHFFYRVKQDGKRELDKFIMNELFKSV